MKISNPENINIYIYRYRDAQRRSGYYPGEQAETKCSVPFFIEQYRDIIQRIEIIVGRNKYQVTELDGNGVCKHQRTVPEYEDPEQVGQCPKQQV